MTAAVGEGSGDESLGGSDHDSGWGKRCVDSGGGGGEVATVLKGGVWR